MACHGLNYGFTWRKEKYLFHEIFSSVESKQTGTAQYCVTGTNVST